MRRTNNQQSTQQLVNMIVGNNKVINQTPQNTHIKISIYKRPYLNGDAIKETMDKYRQHRHQYNTSLLNLNKEITRYNSSVDDFISQNSLTSAQKRIIKEFKKENNRLLTRQYNEAVEDFCNENGLILKKKKLQRLKIGTEMIMHILVGFYAKQIRLRNAYLDNMNYTTTRAIEKIHINYRDTARHNIDGIPRLEICTKTVQNHVKRLREANVITDYEFINSKKPIRAHFNPNIITIYDVAIKKQTITDNQQLIGQRKKELHNNSVSTRTNLKGNKKKGIVYNNSEIRSSHTLTDNNFSQQNENFYKNTNRLDAKKKLGRGENQRNFTKKNQNFSQFLKNQIEYDIDFTNKLTKKQFSNYEKLPNDLLIKEVQYGSMSNAEFRLLIIHEIIKYAARIWENHNVYWGNWFKLIQLLSDEMFISNNGYIFTKQVLFNYLQEYRWRIDWAYRWFNKNKEVKALFPYQYFDKNRKLSSEIGFKFTRCKWKQHLNRKNTQQQEQQKLKIEARQRQMKTTKIKRADRAIQRFIQGKYTRDQLYDYFKDNLGHDFAAQLPNLVKTIQQKKYHG